MALVSELMRRALAMRACAVGTSLAMGFSARTCLPAERAASMKEGWMGMGRAMMTAEMSSRLRRSWNALPAPESSE